VGAGELSLNSFPGAQGRTISWRRWENDQARLRGVVVLAHGFGEHSGRYEQVAERLGLEGYAVYALDHHGHGRSEGRRGRISFPDAVEDIDRLVSLAVDEHPGRPVFLLGHSMGGSLALHYGLAHGSRLSGLIVSGPLVQVEGRPAAKLLGRLLGAVAPNLPVARLDPSLISRDPDVVRAYVEDPLVHHDPLPAGTVSEFLRRAETLPEHVSAISTPTLLMYGTGDRLCDPKGAELVSQRIGAADLTTIPYEGLHHEIFNEPEREQVLDDMIGWLTTRTSELSR
jgi:acylglycerol lipase